MQSNAKTGAIANLFTSFRTSGNSSNQFSSLQNKFNSDIVDIASTSPVFWRDDFVQEGTLGLYNAALKFPQYADVSRFYFYALRSIRSKMLDFYQSVIGRTMSGLVSFDAEGRSTTFKQSIFQETQKYSIEEDEVYDLLDNMTSPVDYVTSTTLAIDFKYRLNKKTMGKSNFTDREISVFDLHFNKGYNVSEIAAKIKLSIPQTSKIIRKAKIKVQQLLT
jgi:RNA polymerase sigma factor (sigma-70 family)